MQALPLHLCVAGHALLVRGLRQITDEQAVTAEILRQAVEFERRQRKPAGIAPEGDKQPVGFRGCQHELYGVGIGCTFQKTAQTF